jgi:hypothetical protein
MFFLTFLILLQFKYYFLAPVLPAFLNICSSTYLIHFHLYGSGFFFALILEANSHTNCLSIHVICKTFFCFSSKAICIHSGGNTSTLCEKPILNINLFQETSNLNQTQFISKLFL